MKLSSPRSWILLAHAALLAGCTVDVGVKPRTHDKICADATTSPVRLATAANGTSVAVLGTTVFFAADVNGAPALARVPRPGGAVEVVETFGAADQQTRALVSDGSYVYYASGSRLSRVAEHGEPEPFGELSENDTATAAAVSGTDVYAAVSSAGGPPFRVLAWPEQGGSAQTIATLSPSLSVLGVAAEGTNVYVVAADTSGARTVQRLPAGGGAPTTVAEGVAPAIAADREGVYFVTFGNPSISGEAVLQRLAPGSSQREALWTFGADDGVPVGVALASDAIYVLAADAVGAKTGKVLRVPRDGGCRGVAAAGVTMPGDAPTSAPVVADGVDVYWMAAYGVMKAPR